MEYTKTVFDCATGKQETIPLTAEEIADLEAMREASEAQRLADEQAQAEKEANRQAGIDTLKGLGLTDAQIEALLGA